MQHIEEVFEAHPSHAETFFRLMCIDGDVVRGRNMLEMYSFDSAEDSIDVNAPADKFNLPDAPPTFRRGVVLSIVTLYGTSEAVRLMLEFGSDVALVKAGNWHKSFYDDLIVEEYERASSDDTDVIASRKLWLHCYPSRLRLLEDVGDYMPDIFFTGQISSLKNKEVLITILNRHGSLFVHFPFFTFNCLDITYCIAVGTLNPDNMNILPIILECDLLSFECRSDLLSTIICRGRNNYLAPDYVLETIKVTPYLWSIACTNVIKLGNPDIEKLITPWMIVALCKFNIKGVENQKLVIKVVKEVMGKFLTCTGHTDKLKKMTLSAAFYAGAHSLPVMRCVEDAHLYHFCDVYRSTIQDTSERVQASMININFYFTESDIENEVSLECALTKAVGNDGKLISLPIPNFPHRDHHVGFQLRTPSPTHSRLCYTERMTVPETSLHRVCQESGNGCVKRVQYLINETGIDPLILNGNGETAFHVACHKGIIGVIDYYLDAIMGGQIDACLFPGETRLSEYRKSEHERATLRRQANKDAQTGDEEYFHDHPCDNVYTGIYYYRGDDNVDEMQERTDVMIYVWPPTADIDPPVTSLSGSSSAIPAPPDSLPNQNIGVIEPAMKRMKKDRDATDEAPNKKTALMVACDSNYYNAATVYHLIHTRKCNVEVNDSYGENVVIQTIQVDNATLAWKLLSLCYNDAYPHKIDVSTWRSKEGKSLFEVLEEHHRVYSFLSGKDFFRANYREFYESERWNELQSR